MLRGHSKSTFVEEERGASLKSKQGEEWGGPSMCVLSLFKKNAEIFEVKFNSYSPVIPINYNGSLKY